MVLVYLCTYVFFVQDDEEYGDSLLGLAVSIMASFGFTFFLSSFVVFPITERESKVFTLYTYMYVHRNIRVAETIVTFLSVY